MSPFQRHDASGRIPSAQLPATAPAVHHATHESGGADTVKGTYFFQNDGTLVAGQLVVTVPGIAANARVDVDYKTIAGALLGLGAFDYTVSGTTLTIRSRLAALGVISTNALDTSAIFYTVWNP